MIHFMVGIPLIILRYMVRFIRWSCLIASYNASSRAEKAKYDRTALCTAVGYFMFMLGALFLLPRCWGVFLMRDGLSRMARGAEEPVFKTCCQQQPHFKRYSSFS